MRLLLILSVLALGACRVPYMSDWADMTVRPEQFPAVGTPAEVLDGWFAEKGYAPGPTVYQAEAQLRRRPGDPPTYARAEDKRWWLTRHRTVRDFCVTKRTIYYRLDPGGALVQAIQSHRSQC